MIFLSLKYNITLKIIDIKFISPPFNCIYFLSPVPFNWFFLSFGANNNNNDDNGFDKSVLYILAHFLCVCNIKQRVIFVLVSYP